MSNLSKSVDEVRAFRDQAVEALKDVPDIQELEVMRLLTDDPGEKRSIELVLLLRKRAAKRRFEAYERWADAFDKAALPVAAALPGFVAVLNSEQLLTGTTRRLVVVASYLGAAIIWVCLRWAALHFSQRAKVGSVDLGKVD